MSSIGEVVHLPPEIYTCTSSLRVRVKILWDCYLILHECKEGHEEGKSKPGLLVLFVQSRRIHILRPSTKIYRCDKEML
jgi:hypothetical protein